ncbi:TBC1 domain family member 2B isoform X1 [Xenopus tropicalis]|uniref:TBC1 domain family member 2B isoform X1 n=1 Tax=Xenopus tropicalis TaxID=8364 RepID=A0A8J0STN8_XENTR|nr:TBC1 domain family member 2B isoform X1 [Xenopus tropicalis]
MPGVEDPCDSQGTPPEEPSTSVAPGEAAKEQSPRLCGYLAKLSGKGPLRSFKNRWFVLDPRKCQFYYFKHHQDAQPLGQIDIGDASFSYDLEAEEGQFEIHSAGRVSILRAPSRHAMTYWLQELQQKRWEYCNSFGALKRESVINPASTKVPIGLVARESPDYMGIPNINDAERARNQFAVETCPSVLGDQTSAEQASNNPAAVQVLLRQWSNDIRSSMQHLRPGKSSDCRKSTFYTNEEWELLNPTPKELEESLLHVEKRKPPTEGIKGSTAGMSFPFDFGRIPQRARRPLREIMGVNKNRTECLADSLPVSDSRMESDVLLKLQSQEEELERLKKDLLSQKELVRLLQQSLRSSQYDKYFASPFCDGLSKEHLHLLQQKDTQIQELNHLLERQTLEKDHLHQEVEELKCSVKELKDQLNMMMETIQAKDEVIMRLSRQLSKYEQHTPSSTVAAEIPVAPQLEELNRLQDSLQGYKAQNTFLNKEILELSALRRNAERREREMEARYSNLEAKMCQIESKYLVLLQEMKTPVCSDDQGTAREFVNQLLEDALKVENAEQPEHTFVKPHTVSKYDIHGFLIVPEDDEEEEKLVAKVRALDLKTLSLTENQEISNVVKWDNYFASTVNREMACSPELKALVRNGIPHEHRSRMWKWFTNLHIKKLKDEAAPGYFQSLLQNALEKQNPASKQIELDLMRTLPNNKHYTSPTSEGIQKLRNVLLAYSWRNPDIGYCQGINRLAAIALLYLDQEDAFWCLVTIVEAFMPRDYYTKTLLGSQVDQRVFKDLMNEKLPRLCAHFEQYKVDYTLITFNWFLVVFVDSVVSDILFRIWDSLLYEGSKVIFRFALGLFKYKEEEILKLQDSMSIFKYLRYFSRTILDARKLCNIAFVDMNPFPLRQIRNRRTYHLEKVRLELSELEAIRADFIRERETNPERRDLISDDEEDS